MVDTSIQTSFIFGLLNIVFMQVLVLLSLWMFFLQTKHRAKNVDNNAQNIGNSVIISRRVRQWYFEKLYPFEDIIIRFGISPNALSFIGIVLAVSAAVFFHLGWIGSGGWFVLMSGTFDVLDGTVARRLNSSTKSGAYLDSLLDRYGDMIVQIGLISYYLLSNESHLRWMVWVLLVGMVGSTIVPYSRSKAESYGLEIKIGIMQRPERLAILGFGAVFSSQFKALLAPWIPEEHYLLAAVIIIITLMTNITAFRRFYKGYVMLKEREGKD